MRKCPICECENRKVIFDINFANDKKVLHGLPEKNHISICENCGFAYACNEANQANYDNYYKNNNNYVEDRQLKLIDNAENIFVPMMARYINANSHIIDIGYGDGSLLKSLKNRGFNYLYGLDTGNDSADDLRKDGIECYDQSIFDEIDDSLEKAFDIVISTCVGEHVFDLQGFIENQLKILKDDGIIIMEVPAVEGFNKVYFPLPNYFNLEHINYFSLQGLDNLFIVNGMERINSAEETIAINTVGEYMLCGVYRKGNAVNITKDDISEKIISEYYTNVKKQKNNNEGKIASFIEKNGDFVLWGCGSYAMQMLVEHEDWKNKIAYAIDNNSKIQKNGFCGFDVFSPQKLKEKPFPVLICSMNNSADIIKEIEKMNIDISYVSI